MAADRAADSTVEEGSAFISPHVMLVCLSTESASYCVNFFVALNIFFIRKAE